MKSENGSADSAAAPRKTAARARDPACAELVRRHHSGNRACGVFENAENTEVQRHTNRQHHAAGAAVSACADQQPCRVADRRAAGEQKAEAPIPLRVEIIAGGNQQRLFLREIPVGSASAAATTRKHPTKSPVGNTNSERRGDDGGQAVLSGGGTPGKPPGELAAATAWRQRVACLASAGNGFASATRHLSVFCAVALIHVGPGDRVAVREIGWLSYGRAPYQVVAFIGVFAVILLCRHHGICRG